ncbi:MAG: SDR family oxidoreductase [Thermodesulfobacteriota bacterium]
MEIAGRNALVLGATRGIGRAVALALSQAGARVAITHFDWPEDAIATAEELRQLSPDHLALFVDLRQPAAIRACLDQVARTFGSLAILVNNIERGGMPVVHGPYTEEQWDLEWATTVKAKWWVMRYAKPLLAAAGRGAVVTISSMAGLVGRSGPAGLVFNDGYAAANRAVSSFTETWARELAPGIRVNELMLGIVDTRHGEGTRGWSLLTPAQRQAILDHTLLGRTGRVDEVVQAVLFLLRDAEFMTGSILRLDGGYPLGGEPPAPLPPGVLGS